MSMDKKPRLLLTFSVILISFLAGAMFMLGGVTTYQTFFSTQERSVAAVSQPASPASFSSSKPVNQSDPARIVKTVSPAIVNIETISEEPAQEINPFFRGFYGNQFNLGPRLAQGMGSGFIINKEGYILTNEHVIHNAKEINVKMAGFEKALKAKVIGSDATLDLAVIKVNAGKDLPFLAMGDSDKVNAGDWVIAIGNPYGLDHTVTVGVISAKGRPVTISSREYKNLLQTDAAINPGNSGGPLLNLAGEVIGINTAVNAEAQGIGFAIPTGTVKEVLKDLMEKGKISRPYMGVYLQDLTADLASYLGAKSTDGVLIGDVIADSPADKAGLLRGDIILKANSKETKTAEKLLEIIQASKVKTKLVLEILREGRTQFVTVTLEEK